MDELKPTLETATSRVWFLRTADDSDGEVHEQRVEYLPGSPFPHIEKGTPHKARNPFGEPATVRWETRPALRTTEFFDTANQLGDEMGPLHGALLAHEYRDVFRPAAGLARLLGRRLPGASRHG